MNDVESADEAVFSLLEARVIASLMEKELTTPDNYPLTINSLTLACNQKSNREPVMALTQGDVGHAVNQLAERGLLRVERGDRAHKVSQRTTSAFGISRKQQAILAVLMVRRPQTLNDLRVRTERMADFSGTEEIAAVLGELMERDPPLVVCLPKGPGQREDRYAHTLCGEVQPEPSGPPLPAGPAQPDRLESLERRVERLERMLEALTGEPLEAPSD
jgi:uncharacterized protein YceH (UPF0502 family)